MGCSASRPDILIGKAVEGTASYFSSSSASSPHSLSSVICPDSTPPPSIPKTRSLPAPLVHHPPIRKGDSHHLVSLTSTTYGSLIIVDHPPPNSSSVIATDDGPDFADHSQSPDSVINTWELMEGLEDDGVASQFGNPNTLHSFNSSRFVETQRNPNSTALFSFEGDSIKQLSDSFVFVEKREIVPEERFGFGLNLASSKPLWKHLSEESLLSKLDPNVASSYERALSSRNSGGLPWPTVNNNNTRSLGSSPLISNSASALSVVSVPVIPSPDTLCKIPSSEEKIVLYTTSLRGIRRTYEDCCEVRMIFRAFKVLVDEKDVSMDSSYKKELQDALNGKPMSLPRVFVRGKYVGGVDEIRQLNESGELAGMLVGFPVMKDCYSASGFVCESCGDARFIPCGNCNGSRKVYSLEEDRVRRCGDCNENGLIRCPACCFS